MTYELLLIGIETMYCSFHQILYETIILLFSESMYRYKIGIKFLAPI